MKHNQRIKFIVSLLATILCLELITALGIVSPFVLSRPSRIATRLIEMILFENLFSHIFATTFLSVLSSISGFGIGIVIAVLMLSLEKTQGYTEFLLDFLRSIPLTTLIPIFIAVYGIGNSPKVAIGAVSSSLTAAITIYLGLKTVRATRKDFLTLYCPPNRTILLKIYLKDGISSFYTAYRLCISIALVLIVVSEMFIGTEMGVGKVIMDKSYTDDRAGQYAAVLLMGIIGWALNKILVLIRPKEIINHE